MQECKVGGQGIVLKMENTSLERIVAVKIPVRMDSFSERFDEEAKTIAKLSHPNIVNVFSCGTAYSEKSNQNFPYIEMEYIAGKSLRELLVDSGTFPESTAVEIVTGICRGLHETHVNLIDHGDIKPDNILFRSTEFMTDADKQPVPIIIDFGIARSSSGRANSIANGTPNYIAPEQRTGHPEHRTSDIYSIGRLMHELLTGTPGDGKDKTADLSPELRRIIQKCNATQPSDRFASASDLADELNRYANHRPVRTGRTSSIRRAKLNFKRLGRWYAGTATILLLATAGFFWSANSHRNKAIAHQKELEGYAEEATEIEMQLRGKADIQDAQLVLLERLEKKLSKSSQKWDSNHMLVAKHSRILNQCAKIYRIVGDLSTSVERNEAATSILADVTDSSKTELLRARAISYLIHGLLMEEQQDFQLAIEDFAEMQRLFEIAMSRPDNTWSDWANASSGAVNRAVVLEQQGKWTDALDAYVRSRELIREKENENEDFEEDLAFIMNNEAPIYVEMGLHKKAMAMIDECVAMRRRSFEKEPTHQGKKFELAQALMNSGIVISDTEHARPEQKIKRDPTQHFVEAMELYRDLVEDNPKVVSYRSDLLKLKCCEANSRYRAYALQHGKEGKALDVSEDISEVVELSSGFELDGESTISLSIFYLSAGRVGRDKDLIDTAVGQFEMMANHYTEMAELQHHLGWAYTEADKFTAAEAGKTEFPITERATRKFGDAFKLKPNNYKFYVCYRRAIKDQIQQLEKSENDATIWKNQLKELEESRPLVVGKTKSADL